MFVCAVAGCRSNSRRTEGSGIKYYRFPASQNVQKEWISKCQPDDNYDLTTGRVCSLHFTDEDYERDLQAELMNVPRKRILKIEAVPSVKMPVITKCYETRAPKMLPSCVLCGISQNMPVCKKKKVSFHSFPVGNAALLEEWIKFANCFPTCETDFNKTWLCSMHFEGSDFKSLTPKRQLKENAIPSILPTSVFPETAKTQPVATVLPSSSQTTLLLLPNQSPLLLQQETQGFCMETEGSPDDVNVQSASVGGEYVLVADQVDWDAKGTSVRFIPMGSSEEAANLVFYKVSGEATVCPPIAEEQIEPISNWSPAMEETTEQVVIDAPASEEHTERSESGAMPVPSVPQIRKCRSKYERKMMEIMKKQLCRICGKSKDIVFPIFNEDDASGKDVITLARKIEMYLPLRVRANDDLPQNICRTCSQLVDSWHELHVACLAADSVLELMFGIDDFKINREKQPLYAGTGKDSIPNYTPSYESSSMSKTQVNGVNNEVSELLERTRVPEVIGNGLSSIEECDMSYDEDDPQSVVGESSNTSCVEDHSGLPFYGTDHEVFECESCSVTFCSRGEYEQHQGQCALEPTICDVCGEAVAQRWQLKEHVRTHPKMPVHFCEPCCKVFNSENAYIYHQQTHQKGLQKTLNFKILTCQENGKDVFFCPVCAERFPDKITLIIHANANNKSKCVKCKKWVQNERQFFYHECKTEICRYCSKNCYSKMSLKVHERSHTVQNRFSCTVCDAKFSSLSGLSNHQMCHKAASYQCTQCGKHFMRKRSYEDHVERHAEVEHNCIYCNKSFTCSNALHRHQMLQHNVT